MIPNRAALILYFIYFDTFFKFCLHKDEMLPKSSSCYITLGFYCCINWQMEVVLAMQHLQNDPPFQDRNRFQRQKLAFLIRWRFHFLCIHAAIK